jgi:hypothetical protein
LIRFRSRGLVSFSSFFFFFFLFGSPSSSYLVMMTASFPRSGFSSSGSLSSGIYLSSCLSLSLSRMSPFEENDDGPSATHPSNVKSTRTPPSPKSCLFVQPKTHCVCVDVGLVVFLFFSTSSVWPSTAVWFRPASGGGYLMTIRGSLGSARIKEETFARVLRSHSG